MSYVTVKDGAQIFYTDWGSEIGATNPLLPRLAALERRLGQADGVRR